MKPTFFASGAEFRKWLLKNHKSAQAMLVGFYKTSSGRNGISYAQALDEALCFGWIDGVRKNIDDERWSIRFSPRKPGSIWSLINIGHVRRLMKAGKMSPVGLEVFQNRDKAKSRIYSYEVRNRPLAPRYAKKFRANRKAWQFFVTQTPSYQRTARWWIIWAKQEETRQRRLDLLIRACERQMKIDGFVSLKKQGLA
ncbi:MAG TPA: YdeI/OmpD-associated family protein [Bacteroidota bacterium]|nr:YdeI/OmpD-associated family protein [Bacteroidota bacterium]